MAPPLPAPAPARCPLSFHLALALALALVASAAPVATGGNATAVAFDPPTVASSQLVHRAVLLRDLQATSEEAAAAAQTAPCAFTFDDASASCDTARDYAARAHRYDCAVRASRALVRARAIRDYNPVFRALREPNTVFVVVVPVVQSQRDRDPRVLASTWTWERSRPRLL